MRRSSVKKKLGKVAVVVLGLAGGFVAWTAQRQDRKFDAPFPDIHASADPAIIERGRYLVRGPAHCADCHGAPEQRAAIETGAEVPLAGGNAFHLPVGTVYTPNITPDPKSGIGRYQDAELARILRHGVRPDGRAVLPFMPFNGLADDDLGAILSYLRSEPPVDKPIPAHDVNAAGYLVKAWVLTPKGPEDPVAKTMKPEPTPAYGRYLAHNVANCVGCHTKLDMRTGEADGPLLGGGAIHAANDDTKKRFVAPNLTPDPTWGWIAEWSEEVFVARMKVGKVLAGSPMPWHAFKRMNDDDLRALYRYLRTVPPAAGGPDPTKRENVVLTAERE